MNICINLLLRDSFCFSSSSAAVCWQMIAAHDLSALGAQRCIYKSRPSNLTHWHQVSRNRLAHTKFRSRGSMSCSTDTLKDRITSMWFACLWLEQTVRISRIFSSCFLVALMRTQRKKNRFGNSLASCGQYAKRKKEADGRYIFKSIVIHAMRAYLFVRVEFAKGQKVEFRVTPRNVRVRVASKMFRLHRGPFGVRSFSK